jgi:ubiquinone/menaquinone biosynthesis methyltransferase
MATNANSPMCPTGDIYNPLFVRDLFDEMSGTYGRVNLISSFAFAARWRKQCADEIDFAPNQTIMDLMSGMGEMWPSIIARSDNTCRLQAIEFSPQMCKHAHEKHPNLHIELLEVDVLENHVPDSSIDVITSGFGLKTFSDDQKVLLAKQIARMLKPGGQISMIEISVPTFAPLRLLYMFYLKFVIPIVGQLFLGNPENYRMLGIYTQAFGDCTKMTEYLKAAGLAVLQKRYFFGCATGIVGSKPT